MARPKSSDPLVPVRVRLPLSVVETLNCEADQSGGNVSDVLRAKLNLTGVAPAGSARRSKRARRVLPAPTGLDPELGRQLVTISDALHQIARELRSARDAGMSFDFITVVGELAAIEATLAALVPVGK